MAPDRRTLPTIVVLVGLALISPLILLPAESLFVKGVFAWHIQQPETWQGGLEILLLFAGSFAALSLPIPRLRWLLVALMGWVVSRRHGVDVLIALYFLWLEGVHALGWSVQRRLRK